MLSFHEKAADGWKLVRTAEASDPCWSKEDLWAYNFMILHGHTWLRMGATIWELG